MSAQYSTSIRNYHNDWEVTSMLRIRLKRIAIYVMMEYKTSFFNANRMVP